MRAFSRLFQRRDHSPEIDKELQFHIDELTDRYVTAGLPRDEAASGFHRIRRRSADQGRRSRRVGVAMVRRCRPGPSVRVSDLCPDASVRTDRRSVAQGAFDY
jgi:hypothetical protein